MLRHVREHPLLLHTRGLLVPAFGGRCKMEEAGDGRESFGGPLCWGDPR
ncbi:hypothetical protein FOMG_18623 [Fusarium oxysporum f. sp. melonis 26406]|uniref:Uncharacterized protein n=1 Tax=Fusarium oxysporum f. sp. melonis 26406 TaxID=1089452 RepID=W9ZU95_FUSOX|nr:hypothetical protein FOMG_18623 [Fusarium oxysporum f. sp. melonis 26406]